MMPRDYDPKISEPKWQKFWEDRGVYRFDPNSDKPIYSVDTPPPTVSGGMHLGHAFSYSHADFIIRFWRMMGYNVFYPFGFDDNGLATERFVENKCNVRAVDMPRKEFVELCLKETEELEEEMKKSWSSLGISPDWSINYRTIDDWVQKTSQRSFIELYKMGREYRKKAPTIWCPTCRTAIAQVELEDRRLSSYFSDIYFELEDGKKIIIATTRPELLPSCVSIFVHPEDERYKDLIGKKAKVPLFGQKVLIIADERVDPEKGTGIVMCCTFGDLTDIEWWHAYKLPLKISITKDGRLNELAGRYQDLTLKEAREAIVEDLKANNLLIKQEKITHDVNVHERCGTEIEFLVTKQWFIRYLDMKDEFIEAGKEINWHPEHMRARYDNWVKGLQWDWCISRQRHYGIPFPVWYCKKCEEVMLPDDEDLPVDPLQDKPKRPCRCGSTEFEGEKDVLDTWATSSLTPQIPLKWREDDDFFDKMYPMSLRPQAHDIITFWAFNTVVKSLLHEKKIPWTDIMISGHALDPHGKKMSKSKGNIIDPDYVIGKYSADCLRLWAAKSKLGEDLPSQEKDWQTAGKFITKLWNASKFAISHLGDYDGERARLNAVDRWILSKLQKVIKESTDLFKGYEYSQAVKLIKHFFWHDVCDNYLEVCKHRLYNPEIYGEDARKAAQYTLYSLILNSLKMMAPIIPHITEELYQMYFVKQEKETSIHISPWPRPNESLIDEEAERRGELVIDLISRIRRYKAGIGIPLNYELGNVGIYAANEVASFLKEEKGTIEGAMRIGKLEILTGALDAEEHVLEIVPDFSTIGPEFKGDTRKIIAFLESCDKDNFAKELGTAGEVIVDKDHKILPCHIKNIKKEVTSEGKKVDILEVPEQPDISIVVIKPD